MAELNEAYSLITTPPTKVIEEPIEINNTTREINNEINPSNEEEHVSKIDIVKIPRSYNVNEYFAVLVNDISQFVMEKMVTDCCFSSLSIISLLMIIYVGGSNKTKEEIERFFNLDVNSEKIIETINVVTNILKSHTDTIIDISNYVFINNEILSCMFRQFYKLVSTISTISGINSNNVNQLINSLNRLITTKSYNLLQNPLTLDDLNDRTNISLLGISCIDIQLSCEFDKEHTKYRSFKKLNGDITKIPMMLSNSRNLFYYENSYFQMVEIPLVDQEFVFGIFLPKKGHENYIHFNPFDVYDKLVKKNIVLYIPKFMQKTKFKLVPLLKLFGINEIFDNRTLSLSKLTNLEDIMVNDIIHETYINVSENKNAKNKTIKKQHTIFRADSAFQYYVYNVKLGLVLYRGIYNGK